MFRALVVDDEPSVRDLTRRALSRVQIDCDVAADGDEALKQVSRTAYHGVVTDLRMPNRHGHSLAVELLNMAAPPRIVVVTGLAEPRMVRDLIGRGVDDVVHKPVDYEVLANKVLAILERGPRPANPARGKGQAKAVNPITQLATVEKTLLEITSIFDERLAGSFDNCDHLPDPPSATVDFIARWEQTETAEHERNALLHHESRKAIRTLCRAIAVAVPVTKSFAVCGDPFRLYIRDVSETGVRMLHTRATNAAFLALRWNAQTKSHATIRVAARVTRCRPLSPFYDIGCQFVMAD